MIIAGAIRIIFDREDAKSLTRLIHEYNANALGRQTQSRAA
jgi:hypothetical protein